MQQRINLQQTEPKAFEAMFELEKYLSQTDLDRTLVQLIKVRVSQLNRCAFCIEMHTQELKGSEQKFHLLNAWKDSVAFTEKEKAALQLAEELTYISEKGVTDKCYKMVANVFTNREIGQLIMLTCTINAWNRIAVSTQLVFNKHT